MNTNIPFAKTKIIGTIGPASSSVDVLVQLIKAGLDVARLNLSHGSHDLHTETIRNIREASELAQTPLPILLDLCGPKIRVGDLEKEFLISEGERIVITGDPVLGTRERISTTYTRLHLDAKPGDIILIDDGLLRLRVEEIHGTDVTCLVIYGGLLKSRKGMNLPKVNLGISSLTEKDKSDLAFGIQHQVDFIALSFVRRREDIRELREILLERDAHIPIVAKIEKPEAVQDIDGIIEETDIVMVARGDLGVEMETEDVPILQKMIIEKCNDMNKPVITATQMLESMVSNPRPTRAEASDVANAVFDGTDAVMLSAETSVGSYPVETVSIMNTIVTKAEEHPDPKKFIHLRRKKNFHNHAENICRSACVMAEDAGAEAIIVITKSGRTAQLLSKFKPTMPVIAFTQSEDVIRRLKILWGVLGMKIDHVGETDATLKNARSLALSSQLIKAGSSVVYVTGIPLMETSQANMIKIETV
ncbi:MAG: pyruvate kinase [Spirochaetales bacterium]|nr:pyruvate kinase [Spirochaetales bacterium]